MRIQARKISPVISDKSDIPLLAEALLELIEKFRMIVDGSERPKAEQKPCPATPSRSDFQRVMLCVNVRQDIPLLDETQRFDDVGISRRHAQLRPRGGGWTIEDLGSTNGVIVNGEEIHGVQALRPGDRIELGSTEVVFEAG